MTEISQASLLDAMETARREEIEREARRRELMATIARHRWQIARNHHRLETGEALDFSRYPFQQAIYEDDALEMVVMGSTQWGKALPDDARSIPRTAGSSMGSFGWATWSARPSGPLPR